MPELRIWRNEQCHGNIEVRLKTIPMIDNKGKNALIFGVRNDSSIAWAIANKLMDSGCNIALSVEPTNVATVEKMTKGLEMNVMGCDIRTEKDIQNLVATFQRNWGHIDYLLHGVAYGNHKVMCSKPPGVKGEAPEFIDIPFEDFMDSFDISAFSLMRICKLCRPLLMENSSVLTLTYQAGQKVFPGYAGMAINKAALENMVKYLAWFFGESAVRVNAISAGLIMTTSAGGIKGVRKLRKIGRQSAPLGNASVDDVANGALYYFSDLSKGVTGNIHFVDGGLNIMALAGE